MIKKIFKSKSKIVLASLMLIFFLSLALVFTNLNKIIYADDAQVLSKNSILRVTDLVSVAWIKGEDKFISDHKKDNTLPDNVNKFTEIRSYYSSEVENKLKFEYAIGTRTSRRISSDEWNETILYDDQNNSDPSDDLYTVKGYKLLAESGNMGAIKYYIFVSKKNPADTSIALEGDVQEFEYEADAIVYMPFDKAVITRINKGELIYTKQFGWKNALDTIDYVTQGDSKAMQFSEVKMNYDGPSIKVYMQFTADYLYRTNTFEKLKDNPLKFDHLNPVDESKLQLAWKEYQKNLEAKSLNIYNDANELLSVKTKKAIVDFSFVNGDAQSLNLDIVQRKDIKRMANMSLAIKVQPQKILFMFSDDSLDMQRDIIGLSKDLYVATGLEKTVANAKIKTYVENYIDKFGLDSSLDVETKKVEATKIVHRWLKIVEVDDTKIKADINIEEYLSLRKELTDKVTGKRIITSYSVFNGSSIMPPKINVIDVNKATLEFQAWLKEKFRINSTSATPVQVDKFINANAYIVAYDIKASNPKLLPYYVLTNEKGEEIKGDKTEKDKDGKEFVEYWNGAKEGKLFRVNFYIEKAQIPKYTLNPPVNNIYDGESKLIVTAPISVMESIKYQTKYFKIEKNNEMIELTDISKVGPTNAGKYRVIFTIVDSNYLSDGEYGKKELVFEILPEKLSATSGGVSDVTEKKIVETSTENKEVTIKYSLVTINLTPGINVGDKDLFIQVDGNGFKNGNEALESLKNLKPGLHIISVYSTSPNLQKPEGSNRTTLQSFAVNVPDKREVPLIGSIITGMVPGIKPIGLTILFLVVAVILIAALVKLIVSLVSLGKSKKSVKPFKKPKKYDRYYKEQGEKRENKRQAKYKKKIDKKQKKYGQSIESIEA